MSIIPPKSAYWLPDDEWRKVQKCLPIVCVDVLPFRRADTEIHEIGLIKRNTPHQGVRWCLIGGRLQYSESLTEAAGREIRDALGDQVEYTMAGSGAPLKVVQYMPEPDKGEYFDPRQHAVSLTYGAELSGVFTPQGEALDFGWFPVSGMAEMDGIGFGQERLIIECLNRLTGHF